jgi:phosphoribosylanthranilate isomerase
MILFAGNITHLTDARYFSAWNVDWMGYQFDPSEPGALDLQTFSAIEEWVEGPETVIELGMVTGEELSTLVAETNATKIKFHPFQEPKDVLKSPIGSAEMVAHFVVEPGSNLADWTRFKGKWENHASYILLDLNKNNVDPVGNPFLNELIGDRQSPASLLVSWPISIPFNLDWVKASGVSGLYFTGSDEEKTGVKSYEVMDEILEQFAWDD